MFYVYKGNLDCNHNIVSEHIKKNASRIAISATDLDIKKFYYLSKLRNEWKNPVTTFINNNEIIIHPGMKRMLVAHAYKIKHVPSIFLLTKKPHEILEKYPFLKLVEPCNDVNFYNMIDTVPNLFQVSVKEQGYYINNWESFDNDARQAFNDVTNHYGNLVIKCRDNNIIIDAGKSKTHLLVSHPNKLWDNLKKLFDEI
jgi:hypothetical protein